ncbi:MAG: heme biosynthesis protein HemY [Alphaproteobacteria bacterium]|nr:heme biosynthesis protein HemY [Alphaproteobacteria bacterium]
MIRVLLFLVFAALAAWGAVWLSDTPGRVTIVWLGYRIDTSAAVLAILIVVLTASVALAYRLWRFLRRAPAEFVVARQQRRRARGYQALTQGMVAVAAGDPDEAQRNARRADALLNDPPITLLLSAQAAQLNGDDAAAARFFAQMLERPETAFLGVRGLLRQALDRNDKAEALRLALRARELRPDTAWVQSTLLDLQATAGQWDQAEATLGRVARMKLIDDAAARHRRAAILIERARLAESAGNPEEALALARRANAQAPDFVPAATAAIARLAAAGKNRKAIRVATDAWATSPHRDIAAAYLGAFADTDALQRLRHLERLVAARPDDPESRLTLAEAALDARLWGEARRHLDPLVAAEPGASARACRLMAEIEKAENSDSAAAERWRARAEAAGPDPTWVCEKCGAQSQRWTAICGHCGAFDSMNWRAPTRVAVLAPMAGPAGGAVPALPPVAGSPGTGLTIPAGPAPVAPAPIPAPAGGGT